MNDAKLAADYTMSSLVNNAVLKSEGTGDGGLFKGIFVRYFTQLVIQDRLNESDKRRYLQFIKFNAETLWNEGTNKQATLFSPDWQQRPGSTTGLTEQLSGSMLIESIAFLQNEDLIE